MNYYKIRRIINIKKIFLDNLPRWKNKRNKGNINWSKTIGCKIKFIYDNIEGEVEIIDYLNKKQQLYIKYINNIFTIRTSKFIKCCFGKILNKYTANYKYNIGDIIETRTGKIQILDQIKKSNGKYYKYKCLIDNNIDFIYEYSLNKGNGCNVCGHHKVLKNYNDLWTTHPNIAMLLKDKEIGYIITHGSTKSEIFVCPDCGYEKIFTINNIVQQCFSCPRCGDGISYPNKFAFNLLKQLDIDFSSEYKFYNYKFDFYFELNNKKYNLEMDGALGHGNKNKLSGQTAETTKEIDKQRDKLVKEHGIEVIRINCKISDLEYIKTNIINSNLSSLFNLSNINWLICHEFALNSRIKEVCNYWNNGIKNTHEIAKIMKLHYLTVLDYIKKGTKLGWCNYNSSEVQKNSLKNLNQKRKKKVVQLTMNGEFIKNWESITEVKKILNINTSNISSCCKNKYNHAGGFKWMYLNDYEKCLS